MGMVGSDFVRVHDADRFLALLEMTDLGALSSRT
jgi:hypothetical protein